MSTQNNQQINLKEKSTLELKAIAYDLTAILGQYQNMLQVVNQEIGERAQAEAAAKAAEQVGSENDEAPAPKKGKLTKA